MNYLDAIKQENILKTTTQNGDLAYPSSGSYCLDFYALMGGMRYNDKDLNNLFLRSFYEDKKLTLKIILHLRDILDGLGERRAFRMTFNLYANLHPKLARQLIPFIPKYGRYDDLYAGMNTSIEPDILKYIEVQIDKDLEDLKKGQQISLLSKWLPSINTSSKATRQLASKIAKHLGLSHKEYRLMVSKLRKGRVLEDYLRRKDYSFSYEHVPSQAFLKYINAFDRNDGERLNQYLNRVNANEAKMNTKTAHTVQVSTLMYSSFSSSISFFKDTYWNNLPKFKTKTKAIIVRDGSSSMTWGGGTYTPLEIATSLALYCAEQLPEPFKNHFITFSESPRLIRVPEGTLGEKINYINSFDEVANTNISKVYQLLLNVAKSRKVKPEDMVEQVIIISDMQFDVCVTGESTFHTFKKAFEDLGITMPQLVFWNVNADSIQVPVEKNEKGVILVSGSSQNIIDLVINNDLENLTPHNFMLKVLSKYNEIDDFIE